MTAVCVLIVHACTPNERGDGASDVGSTPQAATVDETTPIGKKWVQLGGTAVVGAPTTAVTPIGNASYQRFDNGVIVWSKDWGAVYETASLFDAWLALQGRLHPYGSDDLFSYVSLPIRDFSSDSSAQTAWFEKGMLVARGGSSPILVAGPIYLRWWDNKQIGLPISGETSIGIGRKQVFDAGEIDFKPSTGAFAVHGEIRNRWNLLGGAIGVLGFPLSDELPTAGTMVAGRTSRFEHGVIYWSSGTGAWEVRGDIRTAYEGRFGGPAGWLGFPTSGQGSTPASGGTFNDFEQGVVVSHASGPYKGTFGFHELQMFLQRIAGFGDVCTDGFCDAQDVYAFFRLQRSGDTNIIERIPSTGNGGSHFEINKTWEVANPARSDLTFNMRVEAWDADGPGNDDDLLGSVSIDYSIDNLWGIFDDTQHNGSHGDDSFSVSFGPKNKIPVDTSNFDGALFWSFHNFDTDKLSQNQYASTFRDVAPDESWIFHPFDALYYKYVYKGIAQGGNCFGMTLESVNAGKGRSLYSEPIFQYFPDTQTGAQLTGTDAAHQDLINEINIKMGYQLGASAIDYTVSTVLAGDTHNPVNAFLASREAFDGGDDPTISITDDSFFGDGHSVRPYRWDDSMKPWRMYISDPNMPAGTPRYSARYIEVDPDANTFSYPADSRYHGGERSGGRMFHFPYHVLSTQPRTPFWEVFALLATVTVLIVGDNGETQQITDDAGRTYYEPGLGSTPTRWDQVRQDSSMRIPALARLPMSGGTPERVEIYAFRGAGATHHYHIGPRAGAPAGASYPVVFNSGTLFASLAVPGTPGIPDIVSTENIGAAGKAISLAIPPTSTAKTVSWTMSAGVKQRWSELTNLTLSPGQTLRVSLDNGGYALQFDNQGPATTATLRVQAGPGATPVVVGTIDIPSGSGGFTFDAPHTTLTYTGTFGNAGWLVTSANVTLTATDYSGTGIALIEYSSDGKAWTAYHGPFVYAQEGATTLFYRATDNANDREAPESTRFKIDTRAPVVTLSVDQTSYTRAQPFLVHFSASDAVPGSGLLSVNGTFDGTTVVDGQSVDLFWAALGTHTLNVSATDVAGWNTTKSASVSLIAILDSLPATIAELRRRGEIDSDGIANSLTSEANAALKSSQNGHTQAASNQLNALLNHLSAQSGKHVSTRGAQLLAGDVQYVLAHLP